MQAYKTKALPKIQYSRPVIWKSIYGCHVQLCGKVVTPNRTQIPFNVTWMT